MFSGFQINFTSLILPNSDVSLLWYITSTKLPADMIPLKGFVALFTPNAIILTPPLFSPNKLNITELSLKFTVFKTMPFSFLIKYGLLIIFHT